MLLPLPLLAIREPTTSTATKMASAAAYLAQLRPRCSDTLTPCFVRLFDHPPMIAHLFESV